MRHMDDCIMIGRNDSEIKDLHHEMSTRMQLEDVTFSHLEGDGAHSLKKGTRGCTPADSCKSDETHEEVTPSTAPPGSPDPLIEETRKRSDACADPVPDRRDRECGEPLAPKILTDEGHKAVRGDHN